MKNNRPGIFLGGVLPFDILKFETNKHSCYNQARGVYVPPALSVVWLYFADLVLPALATLPRESTHPFPLRIQVKTTEIETGSSIKMMFQ